MTDTLLFETNQSTVVVCILHGRVEAIPPPIFLGSVAFDMCTFFVWVFVDAAM